MVVTRRVLVTRPQPGADATAARLARMGFEPLLLPLTAVEPVAPTPYPDPGTTDAVAVTSANAIRHASAALIAALAAKPLFAVGDASAAAAREAGFADVRSAAGSLRELAPLIARETLPGTRILHLAGTDRTPGLAEALAAGGRSVNVAEIYRANEISYTTDFLLRLAANRPIWGALALSPRAGVLLSALAQREPMREALEKTMFFCISDNAAAPLRAIAPSRVTVSREPTEDGVLLLLSA